MTSGSQTLTRRTALRSAGGVVGLGTLATLAGGSSPKRVAVGYLNEAGRQAALAVADTVLYDYTFDAVAIEVPADDAQGLATRDDIRYVEGAIMYEAIDQTLPWGIDRIDAEVAHQTDADGDGEPETGAGANIAIIDTGIDNTHPDLVENLGEGRTFLLGVTTGGQQDDNGHGTACAGVADAVDNSQGVVGTCTEATLHGIKALSAAGVGLSFDIAAAIDHVAEQGYDVANMSFGGESESDVIADACRHAYDEGVLLVAAAGNSGPCDDCVAYPAALETVVAVSATTEQDELASFSSTGEEIELAAPGSAIFTTYLGGTYARLDGTSFACPHVSGAGALLMANGYSNGEARGQLTDTAENLQLDKNARGSGLVDAAAALGLDSSDDLDSESESGTESDEEEEDEDDRRETGPGGGDSDERNDDNEESGERRGRTSSDISVETAIDFGLI